MKIIFLLFLNVIIIAVLLSLSPNFLDNFEYQQNESVLQYINGMEELNRTENIIIGDSKAECCLNLESYVNFSMGGATPVEGFFLLKRIFARGGAPASVVFSFSPHHIHTQDLFEASTVFYELFEEEEIKEVYQHASRLDDNNYLQPKWYARRELDKLPIPNFFRDALTNLILLSFDDFLPRRRPERNLSSPTNRYGNKINSQVPGENTEFLYRLRETSRVNLLYLEMSVSLLRDRGVPFTFVTMPNNSDMKKPVDMWYSSLYSKVRNLGFAECFQEPLNFENPYFADTGHMNIEGAELFSKYLQTHLLEFCQ